MKTKRFSWLGALGLVCVFVVCSADSCDTAQTSQQQQQAVTETYAQYFNSVRPYPLAAMKDSEERFNLIERLIRMNDPNKIGYVYVWSAMGQLITTYTIKGKVSSTASQLTNTQNIEENSGAASGWSVVDSMGDDGSYGPEEGGSNGVFFFTTNGVLIETVLPWLYADAPQLMTTKPLITMSADALPSSTAGIVSSKSAPPAAEQR